MESGKEPLQVGKSLQTPDLTLRSLNYFTTKHVKVTHLVLQTKVFVMAKLSENCN